MKRKRKMRHFSFLQLRCELGRSLTPSHVDDGIRLDVVHVRVPKAQLSAPPLGGADDPRGDGVLEGERAADGHHELAWSQV